MVIIRVRLKVEPEQRDALVERMEEESQAVRAMEGCVAYDLFKHTQSEAFLLYEEWRDRASFEAYKASEAFGQLSGALRPLLAGKPNSAYYEGERFE